jgi:trans-2,3-dihydro-3-hydroxyanthranilate isomerase
VKAPFYTLDVFTDQAFTGNPLAVVTEAQGIPEDQLLAIAKEFNLSETAFVYPASDPANAARVRIFTPARELPFAGHPTVGTAVLLSTIREMQDGEVRLEQAVGLVPVQVRRTGATPFAQLAVAKLPERIKSPATRAMIASALRISAGDIVERGPDPAVYTCGVPFLFAELRDRSALARCKPDPVAWQEFGKELEGIFVYSRDPERSGSALRARVFAPALLVPEDAATGSGCAALAGYLYQRDLLRSGTHRWRVEQGFEMGRPSILDLECDVERDSITAVRVGGNAVIVSCGELLL